MYVCVCQAISENDVKDALVGGAQTPKCVFRSCGKTPKCGKCISHLSDHIEAHTDARLSHMSVAAE